ncbi:uncharacterized protein IL334_000248 [Kwoniella shivajii]|uniref:Beta-glucuronidase C-terminal domain-containing protein n=1 Tax=Kwoniella shivajii TaxID=564305 RepID=A0ABZ1CP71_9TREE|nr:hypothetical protein IL334_000248 [Kwoniella shivajii]
MLTSKTLYTILAGLAVTHAAVLPRSNVEYDLQSGAKSKINGEAPVAVSLEFFAFPGYVQNVGSTAQCLKNLGDAAGSPTRVRVGGTTQFFDLAGALEGPATIGLNRRLNTINNTIAAAKKAVQKMSNLFAFELGNEPDLYVQADPIANNQTWTPALDAGIQVSWQKQVGDALGQKDIIQGGVFLQPPKFSIQELGPVEQSSGSIDYVRSWADHSYPQSACGTSKTNLETLQNHTTIVNYVKTFQPEVDAARSLGDRPLVFGETNSATCGGGGISPTFGAALWLMDYTLQSVKLGYERLHFHQGTIDYSPYSWWGTKYVFAPYYGAYFAASALEGMSSISQIDDGSTELGVYSFWNQDQLSRAVIYNSVFYPNTTTVARPYQEVVLSNIPKGCHQAIVKRLSAQYSTSQQELGQVPTYAGQSFANSTCIIEGDEQVEKVKINNGKAVISVGASEAVLVYFV